MDCTLVAGGRGGKAEVGHFMEQRLHDGVMSAKRRVMVCDSNITSPPILPPPLSFHFPSRPFLVTVYANDKMKYYCGLLTVEYMRA